VIIPKDNEKDLAEIPDNVKRSMTIIPAATADEVLKVALLKPLVPIEWDEEADLRAVAAKSKPDEIGGGVVTH